MQNQQPKPNNLIDTLAPFLEGCAAGAIETIYKTEPDAFDRANEFFERMRSGLTKYEVFTLYIILRKLFPQYDRSAEPKEDE